MFLVSQREKQAAEGCRCGTHDTLNPKEKLKLSVAHSFANCNFISAKSIIHHIKLMLLIWILLDFVILFAFNVWISSGFVIIQEFYVLGVFT